jgi:hypothetical protein
VTNLEQSKSADDLIAVEAVTLNHIAADHRSRTVVKTALRALRKRY